MVSIAIDGDKVLNIRSSSMIENFILDSIMTLKLHGFEPLVMIILLREKVITFNAF
jgi:hypothetical protein